MYDFNEFEQAFVKALEKEYPEKEFSLRDVEKNNVTKRALLVKDPGNNVAPTVYLEQIYSEFCDSGMDAVVAHMKEMLKDAEIGRDELNIRVIEDPKYCRENLICHLVRGDNNEKYLASRPHKATPFGELVMYINVNSDSEHSAGISVTFPIFESMLKSQFPGENGLDAAFSYALSNTVALFPPKITPMFQVIRDIMARQYGVDPELEEEMETFQGMNDSMYVLSNETGICGAVALAYPDNLHRISMDIFHGDDVVVLPSSVHEVILVKPRADYGPREFLKMVREVNQTQVPDEEVLADDAFYYKANTKEVVRATEMIKELDKKKEKAKGDSER